MIGIGGAVFGTLSVEQHKLRLERERATQRLAKAVEMVTGMRTLYRSLPPKIHYQSLLRR